MAAAEKTTLVEWFWRIHPVLYRLSSGWIGGYMMNLPVLLLTTTGRTSGRERTKALMYLPDHGHYVVVASFLGEPRHPDWWLNLRADPRAHIQVGSERIAVTAREAQGEERERLWDEIVHRQSTYAEYQKRTRRRIPVVVLEPRATRDKKPRAQKPRAKR